MGYNEKPILVRAFELARSGQFMNVKMLKMGLADEGYAKGDPHIHSPSARKQLKGLCRRHYCEPKVGELIGA